SYNNIYYYVEMIILSKPYEPEVLKRLQQCELEILTDFIKICKENNITYFGLAGTGIGALRHGGFIPWDDDIDIGLLYDDYIKLLDVYKKEHSDKYTVINAVEFSDYPLMTTQIALKGTKFVFEPFKNLDCPFGIFLDIFPFYNVPQDAKLHKKQAKKAWFLGKLLVLKHLPFPYVPFKGLKAKLAHCATAVCSTIINILFTHKSLYNKILKECLKYQNTDTGKYEFFFDTINGKSVYTKEDIFPIREIPFENIKLDFPNKLEDKLNTLYGDFMKIPPPEKRKSHHPYALEFLEDTTTHK
ncbi:MAG: LicD family protein, partial [Clostridia bacterium]|nr:LicD family protein [Clostridia bacterium]